MGKTASYTLKANNDYRSKHDFLNLTLDKGEKEKFLSVGIDNKTIVSLARDEYERRKSEADQNSKPDSNDDFPEWFTSPY